MLLMAKKGSFKADWKILLENELKLKGFSKRTVKTYSYHINLFLNSGKNPKDYLLSLINSGLQDETVRLAGFAIKFYIKTVGKEHAQFEEHNGHDHQ